MRVKANGRLPPVDVRLLGDLAAAFHHEWRVLRFGRDGAVIDPAGVERSDRLRLIEGRHGANRARYLATIRIPVSELPSDCAAAQAREVTAAISEGHADPEVIARIRESYADRWVVTGERVGQVELVAIKAGLGSTAFSVADVTHGAWAAEASADHSGPLRVAISARSTMADLVRAYGERPSGWVRWLMRGPFAFDGELDLGALGRRRGGRVVDITGRAGRYPYAVRVQAEANEGATDVHVTVSLRGRGTGRLVVFVAWPFIRGEIRRVIEDELAGTGALAAAIESLRTEVAQAGGPMAYAYDAVWGSMSPTGEHPATGGPPA